MNPERYFVGNTGMVSVPAKELDRDPRGIIWVWEPPDPRGYYVMGIDPTAGIPLWNRYARSDADVRIDNGCIQILRVGLGAEIPDRQVAEYAAPQDPEDLADVANVMGRVYGGQNEDGQAKCIVEIYPGPGLLLQRKMLASGYTNMWCWQYLDSLTLTQTTMLGWRSSQKSTRDLWLRTSRHMVRGGVKIRSPWLVEEMADAEMDMAKMRAKAAYGKHDDRLFALQLAIWCGREWDLDIETVPTEVRTEKSAVDFQASDISFADMLEAWEDKYSSMMEE